MKIDYANRRDFAERFQERKADGKPGWADKDSYKIKATRIDKVSCTTRCAEKRQVS